MCFTTTATSIMEWDRNYCNQQLLKHQNMSSYFNNNSWMLLFSFCIESSVHIKHELSQLKIDDTGKKAQENWYPQEDRIAIEVQRNGHIVSESNTNVSNKLFTPVTFSRFQLEQWQTHPLICVRMAKCPFSDCG